MSLCLQLIAAIGAVEFYNLRVVAFGAELQIQKRELRTTCQAPMRIIYEINVLKDRRRITEPQHETDDFYAVTAFALTLDEAAKKATRFMIDYLVQERGLERHEANMLCSIAADLKIAEVVDQNVLVSMHISKSLFVETMQP